MHRPLIASWLSPGELSEGIASGTFLVDRDAINRIQAGPVNVVHTYRRRLFVGETLLYGRKQKLHNVVSSSRRCQVMGSLDWNTEHKVLT